MKKEYMFGNNIRNVISMFGEFFNRNKPKGNECCFKEIIKNCTCWKNVGGMKICTYTQGNNACQNGVKL